MTQPRDALISLESTPYYHCISRCVRRAYLCGHDKLTGQSYEHRRSWLEDRLLLLPDVFALDIAAYAIMSNHYHVVLHINKERIDSWDDLEITKRWHILFKGNIFSQKFLKAEPLLKVERMRLQEDLDEWRKRLCSISWFMRVLNESIAREANIEDGCTGRFWEGRFKSQALLDESALLACMTYVDLNPVRAGMAATPETSEHTSIKKRCAKAKTTQQSNRINKQVAGLLPFLGDPKQDQPCGIQMRFTDYLELVDCTGRVLRGESRGYKRGVISSAADAILTRLEIDDDQWLTMTTSFEQCFRNFAGSAVKLREVCAQLDYQRTPGITHCRELFGSPPDRR